MKEASPITTGVKALIQAYRTMSTARAMSDLYEANARLTSRYVHACARGHEAIQWATGRLLENQDYLSAYYRDDCLLLTMGMEPEELMLQLLAKGDDPFSGGRTYYSHPSLNRVDLPRIPHQSSATGMQAIPAAGVALGLQYKEIQGIPPEFRIKAVPPGCKRFLQLGWHWDFNTRKFKASRMTGKAPPLWLSAPSEMLR